VNGDTILWKPDQRILKAAACGDDRALVYGCRRVASFLNPVHGIGSLPNGDWYVVSADRSSYSAGVGLDLHARTSTSQECSPSFPATPSSFGATCCRNGNSPDAYRVRALVGVALLSSLGEILIYGAGDVGNRYGIRA